MRRDRWGREEEGGEGKGRNWLIGRIGPLTGPLDLPLLPLLTTNC